MTREEAIKFGKRVLSLSLFDETHEFCELAVKALEQQPCEDTISRSEAIRVSSGYCHWTNIPAELAKLPSVSTEKTGRWILTQRNKYIDINCSKCGNTRIKEYAYGYTIDELNLDEINDFLAKTRMNYCECCGAKMFEPQESEVQE